MELDAVGQRFEHWRRPCDVGWDAAFQLEFAGTLLAALLSSTTGSRGPALLCWAGMKAVGNYK